MNVEAPTLSQSEIHEWKISPDEKVINLARRDFIDISAVTAIKAFEHIEEQYRSLNVIPPSGIVRYIEGLYNLLEVRQLSDDEIKRIGKEMDEVTTPVAAAAFRKRSRQRYDIVDSEGAKDDAPVLTGIFGPTDATRIEAVHDGIDGTSSIAAGKKDSISIIAGAEKFERIPPEYLYMASITVPPEAKKAASLVLDKAGHKKVLENICEELGIKPQELTQVMLNPSKKGREVNGIFFDAGQELGVKHKLLNAGDVMPRALCSLSQEERLRYCDKYGLDFREFEGYMVMVGRGGTPELSAGAAIGRITGAPTIAHLWNPVIDNIDTQDVFTTERLVPGRRELTIFVSTFATESTWFKAPGVKANHDGSYTTNTLVLTAKNGLEIVTKTYSSQDLN